MLPRLADHARPVLRKPPQGPPKRGDLARNGCSSLPVLMRVPAAYHSVQVIDHTHDHQHVIYRSQRSLFQQYQSTDPGQVPNGAFNESSIARTVPLMPLLAHSQSDPSLTNAERLLSTVDPSFGVSDWDNSAKQTRLWLHPDEEIPPRDYEGTEEFLAPLQPPSHHPAISSQYVNFSSSSGTLHNDTTSNWNRYQTAKERSRRDLARRPLWCPGANVEDEEFVAKRFDEMTQQEQWPQHRAHIQRQFKGLPDSKESDMKRRLVGDPRLHEGKRDKQRIHKLKKEDIERDRDKARRIQGVMQQCSKSRHQLVRMQVQLRNTEIEDRAGTRAESRHGNR